MAWAPVKPRIAEVDVNVKQVTERVGAESPLVSGKDAKDIRDNKDIKDNKIPGRRPSCFP
jgi:hypothetical protein